MAELSDLPFAGVMRGGIVAALPAWEKRIPHLNEGVIWPTPTSKDGPSGPGTSEKREGGLNLRTAVVLWPTPTARDWKSGNSNLMEKNSRPLSEVVTGGSTGQLNPTWVEWMMGFPDGYTKEEQ